MALWLIRADWSVFHLLLPMALAVVMRIVSAVHAHRSTRVLFTTDLPPGERSKNPWTSVFLGRLIPGLGHLYGRRWIRAILILCGVAAYMVWKPPDHLRIAVATLASILGAIVILDSFLILRKANTVPLKATVAGLFFIIATSEGIWAAYIIRAALFEAYRCPSASMSPTVQREDRILVMKCAYLWAPPERFDVITFRFPLNQERTFLKRVIGMPGEELYFQRGGIYVRTPGGNEFVRVAKPAAMNAIDYSDRRFVKREMMSPESALRIPEGAYFVIGDNVANSVDSRSWVKHVFELRDGRTVICEGSEIIHDSSYESKPSTDYYIKMDEQGKPQAFNQGDVVSHREEPFPFIDRRFITGRAHKILWPLNRQGPIR